MISKIKSGPSSIFGRVALINQKSRDFVTSAKKPRYLFPLLYLSLLLGLFVVGQIAHNNNINIGSCTGTIQCDDDGTVILAILSFLPAGILLGYILDRFFNSNTAPLFFIILLVLNVCFYSLLGKIVERFFGQQKKGIKYPE